MKQVDLLRQSFTGTGTATIALGSAVSGFRTVAQAIADFDLVIGDEVPMAVREGASWEISLFRVDSPTQLSRVRVIASWAGGAPVTFPAGSHQIFCTPPAEYLNGLTIADLQAAASIMDSFVMEVYDPAAGLSLKATVAALRAIFGGTAPAPDTTAPTAPTNLASSGVTQTGFTVTFTPGTDNVGVARSEWSLNGTTWTAIGNATSFNVADRTAATTYTVRVRTVDTSGNLSGATTLNVTTAAAIGAPDSQAPTWLAGSLSTSSVTSSGYSMAWPNATDNVGIDHYESSIDGGATWTTHAANVTSRTVAGRPAATTDQLRVRALDAAGNVSNVLSATVTTAAAIGGPHSFAPYTPGNTFKTTIDRSEANVSYANIKQFAVGKDQSNAGTWWNITPNDQVPAGTDVRSGWGTSNTVPPASITAAQNINGTNSINGLVPMTDRPDPAWQGVASLWVDANGPSGPWYFWIKVGSYYYCLNAGAGLMVT